MGASAAASMWIARSKRAPGSVQSPRQAETARSNASPCGARGRPRRYSNVVSSGATMPARAPASMDMLQIVMRSSIDRPLTVEPRYSSTWPVPPATPMRPMIARIRSLAVTPAGMRPSTLIAKVCGLRCSRHCVAMTWPTSVVPIPKASAPNAPCVLVWLSPQTIVRPGCVAPSSGPMTWTMPRCGCFRPSRSSPNSAALRSSCATCFAAASSLIGAPPKICAVSVGVEWSIVTSVRSRRRTGSPRERSSAKACGEVTSCTRCRSM